MENGIPHSQLQLAKKIMVTQIQAGEQPAKNRQICGITVDHRKNMNQQCHSLAKKKKKKVNIQAGLQTKAQNVLLLRFLAFIHFAVVMGSALGIAHQKHVGCLQRFLRIRNLRCITYKERLNKLELLTAKVFKYIKGFCREREGIIYPPCP